VEIEDQKVDYSNEESFYLGQAVQLCGEVRCGSKLAAWCFLPTSVLPVLDEMVEQMGISFDARPSLLGDTGKVELFIYRHTCALELRRLFRSIDGDKDIQLKLALFSLMQGYSFDDVQRIYDKKVDPEDVPYFVIGANGTSDWYRTYSKG
jgi:hypothetical protein